MGIPPRVGVLGGGRMGAGIAHAFLVKGAKVVIVERDAAAAAGARDRVTTAVISSADRGTLAGSVQEGLARLQTSTDYAALASCGLVVEAVPEDFELKAAALRAVEAQLDEQAFLASNTSSLAISSLAAQLQRPANFVGLHFFNPVPSSTLIEVVLGTETSVELATAAKAWTEALGKTAVVVHDTPGFASSRLGVAIALEAMRMVEEGVASEADIDAAMVLGYRHPTGPLRTTDIVGLDVRLGIAEYLHSTLGERFAPPQILRDKVARGELGRKTGRGFFEWPAE
jgi:3-hydroxybutyryl-CoA dehydrogenase